MPRITTNECAALASFEPTVDAPIVSAPAVDPKEEARKLIKIAYKTVPGGVQLIVHSPKIGKWMREMSEAQGLRDGADSERVQVVLNYSVNRVSVGRHDFYKISFSRGPNYITASPQDFISDPVYSSCLLLHTKLEEGFVLTFQGQMLAKSTLDTVAVALRDAATKLYRNFIAEYSVTYNVSINEELG